MLLSHYSPAETEKSHEPLSLEGQYLGRVVQEGRNIFILKFLFLVKDKERISWRERKCNVCALNCEIYISLSRLLYFASRKINCK